MIYGTCDLDTPSSCRSIYRWYIYISQIVLYELLNSRKASRQRLHMSFAVSAVSLSLWLSVCFLLSLSLSLVLPAYLFSWLIVLVMGLQVGNLFIDLPRNAVIICLHEPHFRGITPPTHCMQHVMLTHTHTHTCLKFGLLNS